MCDMEYSTNLMSGEFICGNCKKHFPAYYHRKKKYGRTMTTTMLHAAKANLYRHLRACYKKESTNAKP